MRAVVVAPLAADVQALVGADRDDERAEGVGRAVVDAEGVEVERRQLALDVAPAGGGLEHLVDGALGRDPLAEDEALVPEARELAADRGHVGGRQRLVVGEAEGEARQLERLLASEEHLTVAADPDGGAVEVAALQPVRRGVRVGRRIEARALDREAGEQHAPERLGQGRGLVDVGAGEGEAADLLLGALVVGADDVDAPPEQLELAAALHVLAAVRAEELRQRVDDVALQRALGAAHHEQRPRRAAAHEGEPGDHAGDRLARAHGALPDVEALLREGGRAALLGRERLHAHGCSSRSRNSSTPERSSWPASFRPSSSTMPVSARIAALSSPRESALAKMVS